MAEAFLKEQKLGSELNWDFIFHFFHIPDFLAQLCLFLTF
jgi:hypothetical protein